MQQLDLFLAYPDVPGARATDTSMAAADAIAEKVTELQARCLAAIAASDAGLTADQCAAVLGEPILNIRPRCSELARKGLIEDSGARRRNEWDNDMIVWIVKQGVAS